MVTSTSFHRHPVSTPDRSFGWRLTDWAIRLLGTACLAISAYTHLHLAPVYDFGPPITLGQLFVAQGVISGVLGLWLLVRNDRLAWLLAGALMVASAAAVLVSARAQIPAFGPLPGIYEPVWYPEKVVSAVSEVFFLVVLMARFILGQRPRRKTPRQVDGS